MKRPFTFVTVALTTLVAAACENATAPRDAASLGDGLTAAVQTLDGSFSTTAVLSNDLVGEGSAITYAADFGSEFSAISQVDYLFSFGNDPLDFGECLFFTGQFTGEFAVCNGGTTPQLARLLTFPCSLFPDVCDGFRDGVSSGQLIANRFDGSGPASVRIASLTVTVHGTIVVPRPRGGAIVQNSGEGKPDISCSFGPFATTQGTALRTPEGNGLLSCEFAGLPPIPETEKLTDFECTLILGGTSTSFQSQWVRTPSGEARLSCQFVGKPVFNATVIFGDVGRPAQEGAITIPLSDFPAGRVTGEVADIGLACGGAPLLSDPAGKIALIERGICTFSEKLSRALAAGAIAGIVFNSATGGDDLLTMGGTPVAITGVFVGRTTGLDLRAAAGVAVTISSCGRSATCRGAL